MGGQQDTAEAGETPVETVEGSSGSSGGNLVIHWGE